MRSELVPAPMLAVRLTVPGHAVSQRLARVKGGDSFVSTWRSVHLGPVTIGIAVGRAGQVPPILPTSRTGAVSARTQFVSLVVATPRHWEELSPDEQDARLHDRV